MSDEELLQRISDLESAGILTKEEADAKRKPIEDRIAKAKADAEEAERLAREEEEKTKAAIQAKADEFWEKVADAEGEDFVDKAFKVLVPSSGSCDTLAGELIRAIMKIMYRDFNDGDLFYEGYGLETAGAPAAFIADKIPEADEKLQEIAEDGLDGEAYTRALSDVASIIEDFIRDNPNSLTDEFSEDMYDWDGDSWREFAPTYETDVELPRELEAHIEKGNISERDLIDEIEYWEWNDKTRNEEFSIDWGNVLYISGLSREGKDDWERNGYDWLEQYAEDLTSEHGDPEFDIRDELTVDDILEVLPTSHDQETEMKAAQALYKFIQEGNLWDELDGDPRDGAISYAREFVDSFENDLYGDAHYYDHEFESAGITEEQVKAILTCLGADEEAVARYHLGSEEEDDTNESLKEGMAKPSWIKIDTGLTGQHDKSILDSLLGQLSDGLWENSPRMDKYWKNFDVELDGDKVIIRTPENFYAIFGYNMGPEGEAQVKKFFATYLKKFVKQAIEWGWAKEWSRDCEDQLKGFHEPTTVKDVYRVYDKLLNRKDRIEKEELEEGLSDLIDSLKNAIANGDKEAEEKIRKQLEKVGMDVATQNELLKEGAEGSLKEDITKEKFWGHDDQKHILIRADKAKELGIDPLEHATIDADLNSDLQFSTGFDLGEDSWVIIGDDEDDYKEIETKLFGAKVETLKEVKGDLKPEDRLKHLKDLYDIEPGDLTQKEIKELRDAGLLEENKEKEVLHKDSPLKAKLFMCDGFEESDPFEGYDLGTTWNGWACPAFEKDEADRIVDAINQLNDGSETDIELVFDEDNDQFIEIMHAYDEDVTEEEPEANKVFFKGKDHMTEDGIKHLYDIGAFEWTWFETNPAEDADTTFDDYLVTDFPEDYSEEK